MTQAPIPQLLTALRALGENAARVTPDDVTPDVLRAIGADIDAARRLLTAAGQTGTTCQEHPHGPTEPDSGGACLLCAIRSRRRPPAAEPPDPKAVLHALTELGEEETARRFGGLAVSRALASSARGTRRYPPHHRKDTEPQ